jgi:hypothetical protein
MKKLLALVLSLLLVLSVCVACSKDGEDVFDTTGAEVESVSEQESISDDESKESEKESGSTPSGGTESTPSTDGPYSDDVDLPWVDM